ncbi:MAG: hypothetical protein AB8E82_06620 [Aureispira sp.]
MKLNEKVFVNENQQPSQEPVAGWVGGFSTSKEAFAYPNPDLSSLPMLGNMDNINLLDRQQRVWWPEFSWLSKPDDEDSRVYQRFAHDISRLGYTKEGRVYSIICPQQGMHNVLGTANVEVTVTGNRGWVKETVEGETEPSSGFKVRPIAADMGVEGKIWLSSSFKDTKLGKTMQHLLSNVVHKLPFSKANAIRIKTHLPGNPEQPIFPLRQGMSTNFPTPDFAQHQDQAWNVAHLDVEIGDIVKTCFPLVDGFNSMVLKLVNCVTLNKLKKGGILSWNVWFGAPEIVNQKEWANHAEYWRKSIQDGEYPGGKDSEVRDIDGNLVSVEAFRDNFLLSDQYPGGVGSLIQNSKGTALQAPSVELVKEDELLKIRSEQKVEERKIIKNFIDEFLPQHNAQELMEGL